MILLALMLTLCLLPFTNSKAEGTGYIICDGTINVRSSSRISGKILGKIPCGQQIAYNAEGESLDGKLWYRTEYGWIFSGYVVDSEVSMETYNAYILFHNTPVYEYADASVMKMSANAGIIVKVIASSERWCVTDIGFIQTSNLMRRDY